MGETLKSKEQTAIQRLKLFAPEDGYYLAYSGGKDSDCVRILAELSGVRYEAVHNLTTVDAPETVRYVRSRPEIQVRFQRDHQGNRVTMWNLIVRKGIPPLRHMRYCCSELKEGGGKGRVVVTGVRWAESVRRREQSDLIQIHGKPVATERLAEELGVEYRTVKREGLIMNDDNDASRRMVELCYRTRKTMVNPIIDWTDAEVWDFLRYYGCESNPLYQCGFRRIGCIGCPMAGRKTREAEFTRYPTYRSAFIRAFDRMLDKRRSEGKETLLWNTGEDVFRWWLGG